MSICHIPDDLGQHFHSTVAREFENALETFDRDDMPEGERRNRLNQVRRMLCYWYTNYTVIPRRVLSDHKQGLIKEYAEPVYRALDEALATIASKISPECKTRESFYKAFLVSAQSYLYDFDVKKETIAFIKSVEALGRKATITLSEPTYPISIDILKKFLGESIKRLDKIGKRMRV